MEGTNLLGIHKEAKVFIQDGNNETQSHTLKYSEMFQEKTAKQNSEANESLKEIDRFCEAMIKIRKEIEDIEKGKSGKEDNLLKNSPHTAKELISDDWNHSYKRSEAAYPVSSLEDGKYWPPVGRVDNVYGDRNLMCSCPSMEDYI